MTASALRAPLGIALALGSLLLAGPLAAQARDASPVPLVPAARAPDGGTGLGRRIDVHLHGIALGDALAHVEQAAGLRLAYSSDAVPLDRKVWLDRRRIAAGEALRLLLAGTGVAVTVAPSGHVVLAPEPAASLPARDAPPVPARVEADTVPAVLARIVVTGDTAGLDRRARPYATDVLTAADLTAVGALRLADVFRGQLPGLFAWGGGPSSLTMRTAGARGASSFSSERLKTYLDGIEVSSPLLLGAIDPASIERVEVVRGPQGAALHGSGAIDGVIHIYTRKGAGPAPAGVQAWSSVGVVNGGPGGDRALAREHAVAGRAGGAHGSVAGGASWLDIGDYLPNAGSRGGGAYAGARGAAGALSGEASVRVAVRALGTPLNPVLREQGLPAEPAAANLSQTLRQRTAALTLRYAAAPWWEHALVAGHDRSAGDLAPEFPIVLSAEDSLLRATQGSVQRASIRYASTLRGPVRAAIAPSLTMGAEWTRLDYLAAASGGPTVQTGGVAGHPPGSFATYVADGGVSRGWFAQSTVGVRDALWLTAGLRAERDDNFGADYGTAWMPMLGVSATRAAGPLRITPRVAWGRAIRAPRDDATVARRVCCMQQIANGALGPETQHGVEWGVEARAGAGAWARVTAYDQTAAGLVMPVLLTRTSPQTLQQQNVGEIANRGWEVEGGVPLPRVPLSVAGSWSRVESRVRRLASSPTAGLRPGDAMLGVPASLASGSLAWTTPRLAATLGVTRVGPWTEYDWLARYASLVGRAPPIQDPRAYRLRYPAFTVTRASASVVAAPRLELFGRVENLADVRYVEQDNLHPAPGRSVSVGLRFGGR